LTSAIFIFFTQKFEDSNKIQGIVLFEQSHFSQNPFFFLNLLQKQALRGCEKWESVLDGGQELELSKHFVWDVQ
jgi:hypothetical protein